MLLQWLDIGVVIIIIIIAFGTGWLLGYFWPSGWDSRLK